MSEIPKKTKQDGALKKQKVEKKKPTPKQVGASFVSQYYNTLVRSPEILFKFYKNVSNLSYCGKTFKGIEPISNHITSLNLKNCKIKLSFIDSQASFKGAMVVVVQGKFSNGGSKLKSFCQSFVLAEQQGGYFVINDVFRFFPLDGQSSSAAEGNYDNTNSSNSSSSSSSISSNAKQVSVEKSVVSSPNNATVPSQKQQQHHVSSSGGEEEKNHEENNTTSQNGGTKKNRNKKKKIDKKRIDKKKSTPKKFLKKKHVKIQRSNETKKKRQKKEEDDGDKTFASVVRGGDDYNGEDEVNNNHNNKQTGSKGGEKKGKKEKKKNYIQKESGKQQHKGRLFPHAIYVSRLPSHIKDEDLRKLFSPYGKIIGLNNKAKDMNYAFVYYETDDGVIKATADGGKIKVGDQVLNVEKRRNKNRKRVYKKNFNRGKQKVN